MMDAWMDGWMDGSNEKDYSSVKRSNVRKSIRLLGTSSCYLYFIKLFIS